MEQLTQIPPAGWPKVVIVEGIRYTLSHSRQRWRNEYDFYGRRRGVYYGRSANLRFNRYLYLPLADAQAAIAPDALPKWLRVSEGL